MSEEHGGFRIGDLVRVVKPCTWQGSSYTNPKLGTEAQIEEFYYGGDDDIATSAMVEDSYIDLTCLELVGAVTADEDVDAVLASIKESSNRLYQAEEV